KKRRDLDLTEGPLLGRIMLFVLPLIASNLLQTLYNAADMMVVSLSHEANSVGTIGFTGPFVNMVINIFICFSAGANVVVARHLGAKDDDAVSRTVHTSIAMSLLFGVLGGVIGLASARPVLSLMGAGGKLLELAVNYTFIYFCGVPFISLTNYCISILRAKGDTKTPLIVLSLAGLVNVALNLFFVLACNMSVEGVALATVIANAVSGVVLLVILMRDSGPCRFSFKKLRIERHSFANILHIGIPAGLQGALFSLSNMLIQSSIMKVNNSYGYDPEAYQPVVDGNAAAANLEGFCYTATNAICQAAITFTSQHVGAQKYERIRRVMLNCYFVTFAVAVFFCGSIFLLRTPLLALYGVTGGAEGSPEAVALETAYIRMVWTFLPYFLLAFMEVGGGIVRGLGRSVTSTIVSLVGACLFRVVWLTTVFNYVFDHSGPAAGLKSIYLSYPISWGLTALIHLACSLVILHGIIKRKRRREAELLMQNTP
ncbi:MAG: MATE family efflux transporter, partial [Clostridia bacterium]|nr:MATE family efflux transporter [Clostridia bacterium]